MLGNLVEGLMQIDRDGRIIPAMAESYEVSADGRTYTFHLRDAKWSNGANVLEDYLPGTANIQLRKNEQYWDAGNVHLDGLAYQVVNSPDTALSAFKNGTLKVVKIDGEHVQSVMKDESLVENYVMDGSEPAYTAVAPHFAFNRDTGEDFSAALAKVVQALKVQIEANLPGVKINLQPAMTAERIERAKSHDNDGLWSNARYDEIVSNCMNGAYSDYADYWAAMHEAEEIVLREAAIAPLYFQSDAVLIADGVQGVEFHAVGTPRVFKNAVMK